MKVLLYLSLLFTSFLNATTLKIASYNVENLFDVTYNGIEYNEYIPKKHNWTQRTFQKKLLNISEVICDINADIIGLQEIENANVLKKLQKSLRHVGCYYNYSSITHKKNSAIQVALLSKIPMVSSKEIQVGKEQYYRPILENKFLVEGKLLYVYVNHWTSKRSAESKRVLSARILKKRLLSLENKAEYILLGDFNSDYNEYLHLKKEHNDTHGRVGLNHILKTIANNQLVNEDKIQKSTTFLHYNLWLELVSFQRWSHNFYGQKQGLDAIIVPKSMFDGKGIDYVNNSFEVFKPKYLFHKKGYIYRWQYRANRHLGKGYSDHLPIVASFSTQPYIVDRKNSTIRKGEIAALYGVELKKSIYLKNVKVILKTKYHAVIKQTQKGRAIFVYGATDLNEGESYDIVVQKIKNYHGLHEIVDFTILYKYGKVNVQKYYIKVVDFTNKKLENEVIEKIEGLYKNKKLYVNNSSYPIYFKNKKKQPKNGTYLKLKRVQIGYYNGLQLVVWE